MQYPPFPDQTKRIEDPAKARVYLIRPAGGMNSGTGFIFYGIGPAATGPKCDPAQWLPAVPQLGMYPQNPTTDSPWRMIGEVASGHYLCWEEPPHTMSLPTYQDKTNGITQLNMLAGNVYYLRVQTPGFLDPAFHIAVLNEEEGLAILKLCRPPDGYQEEDKK